MEDHSVKGLLRPRNVNIVHIHRKKIWYAFHALAVSILLNPGGDPPRLQLIRKN